MGLVGRVWAEFGGDASQLKKAAQESKAALNDVKSAGAEAGDSFGKIALGATAAVAALVAAAKVTQEVFEFTSEGAQIASLEGASKRLALNYGANMRSIVSSVQSASFNTITEYDAMKSANLALTMNVSRNASEIGNLMEIAIERGRAFGLTTEEAFERLVRGIGRRSTKVLDDLGFTANAISINKEYAESIGVSTQALTDQDKVRALALDILRQGNEELANQGGLQQDISTGYQQITANITDWWNTRKAAAAYALAPLFMGNEEVNQIYEQDKALAVMTGSYEDYVQAVNRANLLRGKTPGVTSFDTTKLPSMTEEEFFLNQYQMMDGIPPIIDDVTNSFVELTAEQMISVGMTGEITKSQEAYAAAMKKAGSNTEKQTSAFNDLNESYEDFIMSALDSMGVGAEASLGVAYAFGEIDDKSLIVFGAINKINQMFETGSEQWIQAMVAVRDGIEDIDSVQLKDKSMAIRINYFINGILRFPAGGLSNVFTPSTMAQSQNMAGYGFYKGMHGGSFVGMAHGGIVPPGFSNDGMPVMVSSGERLEVTPAGNKNIENNEMSSMMASLQFTLDGLPGKIKEAVQTIV
jgi:hypothetical protein